MTCIMPKWTEDIFKKWKSEIGNFFILWGNIDDLQKNAQGEYLTLHQYLAEIFEQRMAIFYSLSVGIQFTCEGMERLFRKQYLSNNSSQNSGAQGNATQKAAQKMHQNLSSNAPLDQLIGKTPDSVLPFLEKALTDENNQDNNFVKKVLIIDFAHNIAPKTQSSGHNTVDRATIETLERFARDPRIKNAGNIVILLTPLLASLDDHLHTSCSSISTIHIPKPDEEKRTDYWKNLLKGNGVHLETDAETLGRVCSGLSLRQLRDIYKQTRFEQCPLNLSLIKEEKRKIFEAEFGGRLKVTVPRWGFDYFGGKENVKEYLLEVRDNILNGMLRRVPMGILAAGPPGTGKTFLFECWAYECGFNFVEIQNPRNMYVGQSEEIMEKILTSLDSLAPVIVIEDEADQSEVSRDVPNGDSGVSNRLRQMKFKFCSDPKRRGKVIWVRITNRDDLLDAAYKRKGRTDENIPFVLPSENEYGTIFEVMFNRYEIPTNITDFSSFTKKVAERLYCTGADIEWMVLESDKLAGRESINEVEDRHLLQAIDDWEMDINSSELNQQIMLAIRGSSKRLRPPNWEDILTQSEAKLNNCSVTASINPETVSKDAN